MKIKIAYDAKRVFHNFTGLGNYSRTLLQILAKHFPNNEYNLFAKSLKENEKTTAFYNHPFNVFAGKKNFNSFFKSLKINHLEEKNIQIFHGLSNELPLSKKPSKLKSVVTVHDLIFEVLPKTYNFGETFAYKNKLKKVAKNADKIIAISAQTKKDLQQFYKIEDSRIEVIYQSCDPIFYNTEKATNFSLIKKELKLPAEYFIYVGSLLPRKNIQQIIEAYKILEEKYRIPCLLIGAGRLRQKLEKQIAANKLNKHFIFLDSIIANQKLIALYKNAQALVYPSFYEGFGLPLVEALLCKCPVITSNLSAMPEAAGPNSILINPNSKEELANAMTTILKNPTLAAEMRQKGFEYAHQKFAPKNYANQIINSYKSLI